VWLEQKLHLSKPSNSYHCFAEKILAGSQRLNLTICM